ncbi:MULTISPECIES: hypothetical protein [unclassified Psychrobacillus]|uniref:hypothetical protein n=1 Tax=unclassified Psychrobacillus TaxID=2636677 RepID=UPI00146B1329|nr:MULTISPECIES: hypothetical protein [unclassified Psychrobacillus]MCM3357308.1 hypothetical protein [Psychrobacillus sp. MER TA 171]NME05416.1 hypothetical protein [Psychrobacillus sp. BL-248-WT-3]
MSERFDLSFKNKEVRMWFYIILPTVVACSIALLIINPYYAYIPQVIIFVAWIIYYLWRFFHRRHRDQRDPNIDGH